MPELSERIETINELLRGQFGIETSSSKPIFRVVWSEDQYEYRLTNHTDSGIELLEPEVRLLPKYNQWIHEKYVLERLVAVPAIDQNQLPTSLVSYEPLWVFVDAKGDYLPPKFEAAKFIIDGVLAAISKESGGMRKYVDPLKDEHPEAKEIRLKKLQDELFGNETDTGDALAYREGVSYAGPRFGEDK